MKTLPYFLVIISAVTHSIWNFLVKKSDNKDIFIGLSKISEAVVFIVPFVWILFLVGIEPGSWLLFVVVAALFVFLYYYFLSQAYKHIDFSVAYSIARSSTLFLPILGFFFLGEKLDILGMLSVVLVTVAVLTFQMTAYNKNEFKHLFQQLTKPGIAYALLTAFIVSAYTLWDKIAVMRIHPFLYFYGYTSLTAFFYLVFLIKKFSRNEIRAEWQQNKVSIVSVGILNTFTYSLVLVALGLSKAAYVGTLRQLSLIFGILLGWKYLKESLPLPKIVSVGMIIIGSVLIAFAH
jgi:drug/metabolite transporter (DMT)-like permease